MLRYFFFYLRFQSSSKLVIFYAAFSGYFLRFCINKICFVLFTPACDAAGAKRLMYYCVYFRQ